MKTKMSRMTSQQTTASKRGFGLAEVLLASGVLILVVTSIVALSRFVIRGYSLAAGRTQAVYLAQEGLEMVRNVRDSFWIDANPNTHFTSLAPGTYRVAWSTTDRRFELQSGTETITLGSLAFQRTITVSDVSQVDATLDPYMKKVVVTVSWTEGGRSWSVSTETYLTNWKVET
jgi:Tfp pilus assembly protein PilV